MYSDAVRSEEEHTMFDAGIGKCGTELFGTWEHWQPASVSHHGQVCCEIVKEWIIATDASLMSDGNKFAGPRWVRSRWEWGPTRYPIHWCDIGRAKVIDCGVHAAIAQEIFLARGVRAFRAQMVQEYSEHAAAQWQLQWEDRDAITTWIDNDMIYHESCAVETGGGIKLWDPSAGWWIDPKSATGYGALRALRIFVSTNEPLDWGGRALAANEWNVIEPRTKPTPQPQQSRRNQANGSVRPLPARARLRSA